MARTAPTSGRRIRAATETLWFWGPGRHRQHRLPAPSRQVASREPGCDGGGCHSPLGYVSPSQSEARYSQDHPNRDPEGRITMCPANGEPSDHGFVGAVPGGRGSVVAAWCEVGYVSSFQVARTSCVPLVGSRHIVLLDDLIIRQQEARCGLSRPSPRGCRLRVGKSRIIREVYGALVSGQSHLAIGHHCVRTQPMWWPLARCWVQVARNSSGPPMPPRLPLVGHRVSDQQRPQPQRCHH